MLCREGSTFVWATKGKIAWSADCRRDWKDRGLSPLRCPEACLCRAGSAGLSGVDEAFKYRRHIAVRLGFQRRSGFLLPAREALITVEGLTPKCR